MKLSYAILTVVLCAAPALAWGGQKAKMDVPFAFTANGTVSPAGTYYVAVPASNGIVCLESDAGKRIFFLARPGRYDAKANGYAIFQPTPAGYVLAEVLMPGTDTAQRVPGAKPTAKAVQIALMGR